MMLIKTRQKNISFILNSILSFFFFLQFYIWGGMLFIYIIKGLESLLDIVLYFSFMHFTKGKVISKIGEAVVTTALKNVFKSSPWPSLPQTIYVLYIPLTL